MAIAVNGKISSLAVLPGCNLPLHCQSCHTEDFRRCHSAAWRRVVHEGYKTTLGGSKETTGLCAIRFDTVNHSFGSSDSSLFSKTENLRQSKVQVAAYYSDSTSGAFEYQGESGYHPLEEVNECEKSGRGDLRLTDAEIARTTVEANHRAIVLFSGMVHSDPHKDISRIELQYIVDDYGDIYIELENNGNILRSPRASNPVNVFIGLDVDDIHRYGEQDIAAAEDHNKINNEDIGGIDNKDDDEERNSISSGDDSSISESSRDWEKLDTANKVHPINFAEKIAKVVSTDYFVKMDRPSNGISIIGLLRPAYVEEESYLRKFLYSPSYSSGDDNYTEEDEDSNGSGEPSSPYDAVRDSRPAEIASTVELENMSDSRDLDVTDSSLSDELFTESSIPQDNDPDLVSMMLPEDGIPWELGSEESDMNSSIYKLDILSVQLVSVYGNQSFVSLEDFQHAEPDILVYSATEIIDRVDNGGGKTKRALRSLLWKRKGLHVEEAFLIGVDSLGVDIRVHCGAEVHTVRIAFDCRANSGDAAERQLRRLLFPRFRHKQRKSRRGRYKAS